MLLLLYVQSDELAKVNTNINCELVKKGEPYVYWCDKSVNEAKESFSRTKPICFGSVQLVLLSGHNKN